MGIYLNPGNALFSEALSSKIYVDKTDLISYTEEYAGNILLVGITYNKDTKKHQCSIKSALK